MRVVIYVSSKQGLRPNAGLRGANSSAVPSAKITVSSCRIGHSVRPECPARPFLHDGETLMPLFTVTMKAGRAADEKIAISRAIHEARVKAGYSDDDMFQRFFVLSRPT